MRIEEFFLVQSGVAGAFWKPQMALGALLVLTAIAIVLIPEILVVMVAACFLAIGTALIGSAWRMRRLHSQTRDRSIRELLEL